MGSLFEANQSVHIPTQIVKYIATCHSMESFQYGKNPSINELREWKKGLLELAKKELPWEGHVGELAPYVTAFAVYVATQGVGSSISFKEYFEGMDKGSHNVRLLQQCEFARKNKNISQEVLEEMVSHANDCSVCLATYDGIKVYSPRGEESCVLHDPFNVNPSSGCVLVHGGNRQNGSREPVIIRKAEDKDYASLIGLPDLWKDFLVKYQVGLRR